jgi:hypothetical protein
MKNYEETFRCLASVKNVEKFLAKDKKEEDDDEKEFNVVNARNSFSSSTPLSLRATYRRENITNRKNDKLTEID